MKNIITLPFGKDVINSVVEHIFSLYSSETTNFSKTAIIFGGKRPSLFLNSAIAKKVKKPFFPPTYFTMDNFVEYILNQHITFSSLNNVDAYYLIYKLTKDFFSPNTTFVKYMSWAREIFMFIENLDIENVENKNLQTIERSAEIGYNIPENINRMLKNILQIRDLFHKHLFETNTYSRGLKYMSASNLVTKTDFSQFDNIFFVNLFYLHNTEVEIIKNIISRFPQKTVLFFSGEKNDWSVLKSVEKKLDIEIPVLEEQLFEPKINFFVGTDTHSQIGIVREIIKTIPKQEWSSTVIVLPDETKTLPLLSEISYFVSDLNISLGYSFQHSTIYSLIETIFSAQLTKKVRYYTKNYLDVMFHPVVKSYIFKESNLVARTLIQKIEELLIGSQESILSTSITIDLTEIESLNDIYISCINEIGDTIKISKTELLDLIKTLHNLLFRSWESIDSLSDFINTMKDFVYKIVKNTKITSQPTNLQAIELVLNLCDELSVSLLNKSSEINLFTRDELYKFFLDLLKSQKIAFQGSPLKGLQILGLLETRSLSFDNVIIIDVNESVLPKIKIYEPLIPREIMLQLGINRLEKEEEIQKYHFKRLINSAKNVYLIYVQNNDLERSRFIEELMWEKQKKLNFSVKNLVSIGRFNLNLIPKKTLIPKNEKIVEHLEKFTFSSSSIDTYIKCPLQFYFKYVLRFSEKEVLSTDLESNEIGTFIHNFLKNIFVSYVNKKPIINDKFKKKFYGLLEKSFNETFLKRMKSDYYLLKEVLYFWMEDFIEFEQKRILETEKILYLEQLFKDEHFVGEKKYNFKVVVDRIDLLVDGSILILDYKTGSIQDYVSENFLKYKNEPLSRTFIKEKIKSFQLPIYIKTISKYFNTQKINAAFYCLKEKNKKLKLYFDPKFSQQENYMLLDTITTALNFVLTEICDIKQPFIADKNNETLCEYCPFTSLCK